MGVGTPWNLFFQGMDKFFGSQNKGHYTTPTPNKALFWRKSLKTTSNICCFFDSPKKIVPPDSYFLLGFFMFALYQPTFLGTVFAMSFWPWGNDPYKRPRYKMHPGRSTAGNYKSPMKKGKWSEPSTSRELCAKCEASGGVRDVPCKESFAKRPRYKRWCLVATNSQLWDLLIARDLTIRGRWIVRIPLG